MNRERLYRTEAIILRRRDQGEADRVLTVFTRTQGKQQLLAKGVRKTQSRKAGHVELFAHSQLLVAKGSTWGIVTQAEMVHAFRPVREDLMRTSYAYYLAELVDRFTQEGDENRALFELVLGGLGWLEEARDLTLWARFMELRLLALVGYRPQLFQCVRCQAAIEPIDNFWSRDEGGVVCARCGEGSISPVSGGQSATERLPLAILKVLRFMQTRDWETVSGLRLNSRTKGEIERMLQAYIVFQLERTLNSMGFLQSVRRLLSNAA